MLYIRAYRDRLVNALFKNTEHEKLMKHWSAGQLIHWRWSSLSDVVEGFLEREQALRGSWDLSKLLDAIAEEQKPGEGVSDMREEEPRAAEDDRVPRPRRDTSGVWTQFDKAISSDWFWAYARFLYLVEGKITKISTWMEACSCHGWKLKSCPLKGRRCADLANGTFAAFLSRSLEQLKSAFLACVADLQKPEDRSALLGDFRIATDLILTEATLKTSHWSTLPWMLCGLASSDAQLARDIGRKCVALFEETLSHQPEEHLDFILLHHHPLSKLFLHKDCQDAEGLRQRELVFDVCDCECIFLQPHCAKMVVLKLPNETFHSNIYERTCETVLGWGGLR